MARGQLRIYLGCAPGVGKTYKMLEEGRRRRDRGTDVVSQQQLLRDVWGQQYVRETNYLRQYMAQLRRKLEADPPHPRHLLTEPGMGYRLMLTD